MSLADWFRGYSAAREIHAVFHEDGTRSELHAVTTYYNLSGSHIKTGFGGELTAQEKRICENNPDFIKRSPFSYDSSNQLNLSSYFAGSVSAIVKAE